MAELDQAVVNLERFIGLLGNAISAVGQVEEHVVERGRQLGELEVEAGDAGQGLNDGLQHIATTLEAEEADALTALGDLARAAGASQEDVVEVDSRIERAATDLDSTAAAVGARLQQAATQLDGEGFEPFAQELETAQQALEAASRQAGQALDALLSTVSTLEAAAETDWHEAQAEVESSTASFVDGESALEDAARQGIQGFDAAADELESACGAVVKDVDLIYDGLDSAVSAEGSEWEQAVDACVLEVLRFVGEALEQGLETAATAVSDGAFGPLEQEYEALGTVLDAAAGPLADLPPLSAELARAQSVVGQIDELLNTLG